MGVCARPRHTAVDVARIGAAPRGVAQRQVGVAVIAVRIVEWVAVAGLVWMLSLVARRPQDIPLRWITAMVACWTANVSCIMQATEGGYLLGLDPMWWQLIGQILVVTGAYCQVRFFSFTLLDEQRATVRGKWNALMLVIVVIVLVVATVIMPADLRLVAAKVASRQEPDAHGVAAIAWFYTTANAFVVYANVMSVVLVGSAVRYAAGWFRRALLITTVGLTTLLLDCIIFVFNGAVLFVDIDLPTPVHTTGVVLLLPGMALTVIGISLPAAVTRVTTARIWLSHGRIYHALAPLWDLLHAEFPEDALTRLPTNHRIRLSGVHRRFYRRVIECRDGLVRISPHVAKVRNEGLADAALAVQLVAALDLRSAGSSVGESAAPIALPTADGLDADVSALVALSRDLKTTLKGLE
ncbi:MAB_1171c family putative transporter [Nocardia sp. NPDC088792]|uniref:MAB_1171c family putative transporter n=1 Tax=Nocardia sp. NPDC088792 TaxID=3364332 RepID=UPI00381551C3